jgi:6-phosphogluconolactonase
MSHLVFLGTYTDNKASEGVYAAHFDDETGALTLTGQTARITNPTFVAADPTRHLLLSVGETGSGTVHSLRYDPESGALTPLSAQSAGGAGTCHVNFTKDGRYALAANYSGGSVALLPVNTDGTLAPASDVVKHEGSGPKPEQNGPRAHQFQPDPVGRFALAVDLGCDRVFVYRIEDSKLVKVSEGVVPPGSGPRHLAFSPDARFAYVISEHGCTVTTFRWDGTSGTLTALETISTLPEGYTGQSYCADIHMSADGRFLYGSNRGHDSIAVFAVEGTSGRLTPRGHVTGDIRWPRNFAIAPSGRWLLVANQNGDSIVTFARDAETGALTPTGQRLSIPAPVCIEFAS